MTIHRYIPSYGHYVAYDNCRGKWIIPSYMIIMNTASSLWVVPGTLED